jgi:hypothetical protein
MIYLVVGFVSGVVVSWVAQSGPWPEIRTLARPRRGVLIEFPVTRRG